MILSIITGNSSVNKQQTLPAQQQTEPCVGRRCFLYDQCCQKYEIVLSENRQEIVGFSNKIEFMYMYVKKYSTLST